MKKALSILVALLVVVIGLSGCAGLNESMNERMIIGTWTAKNNVFGVVTETEYTFNEDGTGSMSTVLGIGIATTYTIDEDSITINTDTPGLQMNYTYTYEFVDGDLVLTGSDGTQTILSKE